MIPPVIISDTYQKEVCRVGQGAQCCRYAMVGPEGIECAKSLGNEGFYATLRARPIDSMVARSDNCEGYQS